MEFTRSKHIAACSTLPARCRRWSSSAVKSSRFRAGCRIMASPAGEQGVFPLNGGQLIQQVAFKSRRASCGCRAQAFSRYAAAGGASLCFIPCMNRQPLAGIGKIREPFQRSDAIAASSLHNDAGYSGNRRSRCWSKIALGYLLQRSHFPPADWGNARSQRTLRERG